MCRETTTAGSRGVITSRLWIQAARDVAVGVTTAMLTVADGRNALTSPQPQRLPIDPRLLIDPLAEDPERGTVRFLFRINEVV